MGHLVNFLELILGLSFFITFFCVRRMLFAEGLPLPAVVPPCKVSLAPREQPTETRPASLLHRHESSGRAHTINCTGERRMALTLPNHHPRHASCKILASAADHRTRHP